MKTMLMTLYACLVGLCTFAQDKVPSFPTQFTVAKDGSGDFKTIQQAINAVRDLSQLQVKIYIKDGTYKEKLVIPSWKTNISLIGESKERTIITYDDHSGREIANNDPYGNSKINTFTSYTVLVQGNDITIENLTIENNSGRKGQGVALHVEGDRFICKDCKLLGNQDTIYAATEDSRQYYKDCYIEGTTDFVFGEATVVMQSCVLNSLIKSAITAPSTRPGREFGYVFFDCKLIATDTSIQGVALGRPWRPYGKTVFINTEMGAHIAKAGWNNWSQVSNESTAYFAEYNSTGPGAAPDERVKWSKQLTRKEVKKYTLANIFKLKDSWVP